jgi:hypothetical protein
VAYAKVIAECEFGTHFCVAYLFYAYPDFLQLLKGRFGARDPLDIVEESRGSFDMAIRPGDIL